jgi:hypothetical protein
MYRNTEINRVVFVIVILTSLTVGAATAATVTQSINYQGKLTDSATNPLNGTYSITFGLFDSATEGRALATDTHDVVVTKGLFTTSVTFDSRFFDGRALWLAIKVGADPEMTPRQVLRPVPYALTLRPGAWITSVDGYSAVNLQNTGGGIALNVSTTGAGSNGVNTFTSGDHSFGVLGYTKGKNSPGLYGYTENASSAGVIAYTNGAESQGVSALTYGPSSAGVLSITMGDNSPGVYGSSQNDIGVYGKGREGGSFSTNSPGTSVSDLRPGVNVSTKYDFNPGVSVMTDGGHSDGVRSFTSGDHSFGVLGYTHGQNSVGFYGYTEKDNSPGVVAYTNGGQSPGVSALTYGPSSAGIFSESMGGNSPAVRAIAYGPGSNAVWGSTSVNGPAAVAGTTTGDGSYGLYSLTSGSGSHAVYAKATGPNSNGVVAFSDQSPAIWAQTYRSDNKYGVQTPNIIRALNYETGSSDVAEYMPIYGNVSPGTVLVIGSEGKLHPSATAYDTKVAGIITTAPGVSLGAKEEGNQGEALIAIAGRVPCRVDARHTAIHAGDILTTSDNPGYAMKAEPVDIGGIEIYRPGTILGKAMSSLESGTGTIEVLVTLQ